MKCVSLFLSAVTLVCSFVFSASAAESIPESVWLVNGSGTWKDATRWKNGQIPQEGCLVRIPSGATAIACDADAEYLTLVSEIARDGTTDCWLVISNETALTMSARCYINVRKVGAGELTVDHTVSAYHLLGALDVQEGNVTMRDSLTGVASTTGLYFGSINVASGCEVKMSATRDCRVSGSISGAGTISCTASKTLYIIGKDGSTKAENKANAGDFSGTLTNLKLNIQSKAGQKVSNGPLLKAMSSIDVSNAYLGFADVPGEFAFRNDGTEIEYLGNAASITSKVYVVNGAHTATYNAGPFGGTTWSLNTFHGDNAMMVIEFTGTNAATSVYDGTLPFENRDYAAYVKKTGSGTWKIGNKSYGNHGVYDIQKGTLEFEQLAEKGGTSALGTATICHSEYSGTRDDTKAVDYTLVLGDGTTAVAADTATLKYTGTDAKTIEERPVVVRGAGRFASDNAAVTWTGFKSLVAGENTLILGGAASGNVAYGVADGAGTLSLQKDGAGDWTVNNPDTTGDIAVKAGRLNVKVNRQYRWYKIIIKQLYSASQNTTMIGHFGFYDVDGVEQGLSLTYNSAANGNPQNLQPGQCCAGADTSVEYDRGLEKATQPIEWNVNTRFGHYPRCELKESDSSTWAEVVFRLPDDSDPVVKYDISPGWYGADVPFGWTPTAWAFYGSTDGSTWDLLHEKSNYTDSAAYLYWMSDLSLAATNKSGETPCSNPAGFAVAAYKSGVTLPTIRSVSVASGATLASDDPILSVNKLVYTPSEGAGTLSGFTLAASGTLDLASTFSGSSLSLPYTFTDCEGVDNLSDWSISVGGVAKPSWKLEKTAGGLTVTKPGLYILFK